jgi:TPR repeat protein
MKRIWKPAVCAVFMATAATSVLAQSVPEPVQLSKFAVARAEANRLFSLVCDGNGKSATSKAGAKQVNDALNQLRKIGFESKNYLEVATAATALGNAQGYKECYAHQVYREQFSKNSYSEELAARLHKAAAGYGYPVGMSNYGNRLLLGKGVSVNAELGLAYLEAAFEGGYKSAALSLANNYMKTKSVRRDLKKAKYWLAKAAQASDGVSPAAYGKAKTLYDSLTVEAQKAATPVKPVAKTKPAKTGTLQVYPMSLFEKERIEVASIYGTICDHRSGPVDDDFANSGINVAWSGLVTPNFEKGDPRRAVAIDMLARSLSERECWAYKVRDKQGKPKHTPNDKNAVKYFKVAAEMGYPVAMNNYGLRLIQGKGVAANVELGLAYLEGAIEGEYWFTATSLAQIYMSQRYGVQDLKTAREWLELSRKHNDSSTKRFKDLDAQLTEMGG